MQSGKWAFVWRGRLRGFALAALIHRRLPLVVAALAAVLALPSLRVGLLFDDYHHKLLMQRSDSPVRLLKSPLDMFCLLDGDPRRTAELIDYGFLPWWTYEGVKGAFWRPLASLTHWLDYLLWPETPALMHAQSIIWYALLTATVAVLYQRLMGLAVTAGLAALFYCVDDAHGGPVGFLANRNALLAALFGVLCLLSHDAWRRADWRAGATLGPLLLALSLLSKEEGIATCAYLIAYELFLDKAPWRRRLSALTPYAAVVLLWRGCWALLGYGVSDLGLYVDPLAEPVRFGISVASRAPILLMGQLAAPPSGVNMLLAGDLWVWFYFATWAFLVSVALIWKPLLIRDRLARFWATGMVLTLIPISATFPSDRMLLFVGVGAMGLMAQFLTLVFGGTTERSERPLWRVPAIALGYVFVVLHLVLAPPALLLRASSPMGPRGLLDRLYVRQPMDRSIEQQDLVFVNPPAAFFVMGSPLVWASQDAPMPLHIRVLTSSLFRPVQIHRPDERTLVVRPQPGFLAWAMDKLWRSERRALALGEQIRLTGMIVEITELTADNRPAEATFRFSVPLEDPSLRWLRWHGGAFVPFQPPTVGSRTTLNASRSIFQWYRELRGG